MLCCKEKYNEDTVWGSVSTVLVTRIVFNYASMETIGLAFTFAKRLREEAPIIPEKVRAGEVVRESPPIEEYSQIKRSIAKAKMTSDYLKEALEEPTFDINKV